MRAQASLPMYDLPALRAATQQWWHGVAQYLRAAGLAGVPQRLCAGGDPAALWRDPALFLSQTCGYPFTHALAGRLQLIATPAYRAPGCQGPRYASAILVHADSRAAALADLRGYVCAYNSRDSHSGYNTLRAMIAPLAGGQPFFARVMPTGSHAASALAVGQRRADVCAIDAVTHALMKRHAPAMLAGTRILAWSASAPGLPYVTRAGTAANVVEQMRAALIDASADPALAGTREALLLDDIVELPLRAYEEIPTMENTARRLNYAELA